MIGEATQAIRNYFLQLSQSLDRSTDRQLLERFIDQNDQEAFAALVRRHGPMVLGTCRRLLGFAPETEDVFQATFLSLTRHARSLRQEQIGGWLYRVTFRLAQRAKKQLRKTTPLEESTGETSCLLEDLSLREVKQVLDEELNRLPERFRDPLILCYLQGLTRDEAAKQLGCSLAMLKRRLETGRERLRTQLTRRGLAPALILLAISPKNGFSIQVPNPLMESTLRLTEFGTGCPVVPHSIEKILSYSPTSFFSFKTIVVALLFGSALIFGGSNLGNVSAEPNDSKKKEKKELSNSLVQDESRFETPLPSRVIHRFGSSRFRHTDGIQCSSLSQDGKILVTSARTNVAVWNTETGQMTRIFRDCGIPDGFGNMTLTLSPDGKTLAHQSEYDVAIRIWDIATGKQIGTIGTNPPRPEGGNNFRVLLPLAEQLMIHGVRFSLDGKQLWVDGLLKQEHQLHVYRLENTKLEKSIKLGGPLEHIHFEKQLALIQIQNNQNANNQNNPPIYSVFDLAKNKEISRIEIPSPGKGGGSKAQISNDGKKVAIIDGYKKITVWDAFTGKQLFETELEAKEITDRDGLSMVKFSSDNQSVFIGASRGQVYQFDLSKQKIVLKWHSAGFTITGLHPTLDGKQLITTSWDQNIRRWDLVANEEILSPDGYSWSTRAKYSPDGKSVYVCDLGKGRIDRWDALSGKRILRLVDNQSGITLISVSPDGNQLTTGHEDGQIRLWDANTGKAFATFEKKRPPNSYFSSMIFHPDKNLLYSADREMGITCWDLTTGKSLWRERFTDGRVIAFSPDQKTILSGGWKRTITWHDSESGKELATEKVDPNPNANDATVNCISFSPDGKSFVSCHHDVMRIWDMASRKVTKVLRGHRNIIWKASFSRDGKWLVSCSFDHTIRIWEVATGQEIDCLKGHDGAVNDAELCIDGKRILSSSGVEVYQWDLEIPPKSIEKLSDIWDRLADTDGSKAYRAIWSLIQNSKESIPFLREKIHAVAKPDPDQVKKWVHQLGSARFTERERAKKKLLELGESVEGAIRGSLKETTDPDIQERLKLILEELTRELSPDNIRRMRVIQALELSNTPEARMLLSEWAKGAPGASLTEEAKEALQRENHFPKDK